MGRQDDATSAAVRLTPPVSCTIESAYGRQLNEKFLHHYPQSRSWTNTGHATTPRRKQDSPGQPSTPRRCVPYRYTYLAQCGTPVNCLPLAYKRRRQSPCRRGEEKRAHPHAYRFHNDISTCLNQKSLGPGGPASSPATLVAPLCKHHGATQYSAPSTQLLNVRTRLEPG
jgi:hypothetical protein